MRPNMESLELTWRHAAHLLVWFALFTEYLTTKKKIGVSVFQNINALIRHFVTNLSVLICWVRTRRWKKKIADEANYKPTTAPIPVKTSFGFIEVHLIASQLFLEGFFTANNPYGNDCQSCKFLVFFFWWYSAEFFLLIVLPQWASHQKSR